MSTDLEKLEAVLRGTCGSDTNFERDWAFTKRASETGAITFNAHLMDTMRKFEIAQVWLIFILQQMKLAYVENVASFDKDNVQLPYAEREQDISGRIRVSIKDK